MIKLYKLDDGVSIDPGEVKSVKAIPLSEPIGDGKPYPPRVVVLGHHFSHCIDAKSYEDAVQLSNRIADELNELREKDND